MVLGSCSHHPYNHSQTRQRNPCNMPSGNETPWGADICFAVETSGGGGDLQVKGERVCKAKSVERFVEGERAKKRSGTHGGKTVFFPRHLFLFDNFFFFASPPNGAPSLLLDGWRHGAARFVELERSVELVCADPLCYYFYLPPLAINLTQFMFSRESHVWKFRRRPPSCGWCWWWWCWWCVGLAED